MADTDSVELRTTVYSSEPSVRHLGALLADMAADIHRGRGLAWRLFVRDLSAMYRQTWLGYAWAFLPPLVGALTFIFLQSQGIVQIDTGTVPYPAFAMIGTLLWQTFVESMQAPTMSVQSSKSMLAKINFPREAILVSGLYMVTFNLAVRLLLVAGVMAWWGIAPGASFGMFPLAMAATVGCGFAVGMALLPLGALYGDVGRSIPIVAQFWMLLTPVVYPARTTGLAGMLATWNPISPVIVTARESLTGLPLTMLPAFLVVAGVSLAVCVLGLVAYRLAMPILIERMGG